MIAARNISILIILLLIACCDATLRSSINFCNDDTELSQSDIDFLKSNHLEAPNDAVKTWTLCYYEHLNLLAQQNDVSTKLSRAAFVAQYPALMLVGPTRLANCINDFNRNPPGTSQNEKTWLFHKCMVNGGFKL